MQNLGILAGERSKKNQSLQEVFHFSRKMTFKTHRLNLKHCFTIRLQDLLGSRRNDPNFPLPLILIWNTITVKVMLTILNCVGTISRDRVDQRHGF